MYVNVGINDIGMLVHLANEMSGERIKVGGFEQCGDFVRIVIADERQHRLLQVVADSYHSYVQTTLNRVANAHHLFPKNPG